MHAFNLNDYIMSHVLNGREWHIPFLPTIHLPEFLTLHTLMIALGSFLMLYIFCFLYKRQARVPTGMTNALETIIIFLRDDVVYPFLGEKDGRVMMPLFCTFFFFILILNLLGLFPLFSTATANVNVTGALAFVSLVFMVFGTILKNGLVGFGKALVPPGVPLILLLLVVPLEFAGLFIKAFALMIRLFANMLAGHIVVLSFLGMVTILGWVALPAVFLALFIYAFEVFVAFLQAYIFTLLSAVFIGQMYHPSH